MRTTPLKLIVCICLLCLSVRLSADPVSFNFDGALPYDYSGSGLGAFNNTTFSGTFSYDDDAALPLNGYPNISGAGNVGFHLEFSNGYHVDFATTLLNYSPWYSGLDLLTTAGPMYVSGGVFYWVFSHPSFSILDAGNNATGVMLNGLAFMYSNSYGNSFANGFTATNSSGQINLNNAGLGAFNVNISPVPDAASTLGLLSASLLGLGLMRRRLARR